jgi:ribonuclease R
MVRLDFGSVSYVDLAIKVVLPMREKVAAFMREQSYKPMTFEELAAVLAVPTKQHAALQKLLEEMENEGQVVRTRTDRFGTPERMNLAVGRLQGHPKGFAFLIPDDPENPDVFIGRENLGGAWHSDRVIARLTPSSRGRMEGEVIRILKRTNVRVVGTFETDKNASWVKPDEQRLPDDILVPRGATNGAKSGEKVVVHLVRFPDARRAAEGKVVERLGMKGTPGVDILSVIRKFNLPEQFPPKVLAEADAIPDRIPPEEYERRRDLRGRTIITIDGEDAKDLDDAVEVQRLGPGRWRLGVHIADVSHYVKEGSALDAEALRRGTSVYLADRVVPMLPPKLSNNLCSLNPQADRLTMSCVMEINERGGIESYEIFPSVIRTAERMTYTNVNRLLQGDSDLAGRYERLLPMLREMETLMAVLQKKRLERGALNFDLPEAKVKLNEAGFPVEIYRLERGPAEKMIEEFMIVANETVAEHASRKEVPFMYRVHEEPAPDKLLALKEFLSLFDYELKLPRGTVQSKLLQAVTAWAEGRKEENLINTVVLRSMKQAQYSVENLGHFGLAASYYTHFTSPIRRYPDLVVHRVLREMLAEGGIAPKRLTRLEKSLPEAARHSSERERLATDAERETLDLKKAEFMLDKVGNIFEGLISGITGFGFFVQLSNTVEGLVHVSNLDDDYYHFHDRFYALIGERTKRRFRLGDTVTVRCTGVEVESRAVDFTITTATEVHTTVAVPDEGHRRAARTEERAAAPAKVEQRKERTRRRGDDRPGQRGPERVNQDSRAAARVDMWGIPIRGAKLTRGRDEEDPTVTSPYAIAPPKRDTAERAGRAGAEAPFAPSAPTADETAGMPATVAVGSPPAEPVKAARRRRRSPRRGRTPGGEAKVKKE